MKLFSRALITLVVGVLFACQLTSPSLPADNEILDGPIAGLSLEQQRQFLLGDEAFGEVFTSGTGLGPIFVAGSCASCHAGDGKGHPFITFTRFGQSDTLGNTFLNQGGPQLQHKALPGYQPEQLPVDATSSDLIAPAVTGLGFMDAVSDATLLALSDPDDLDGDGVSGIPHWNNIPEFVQIRPNSISQNGKYITRFGKKGAAYDLLHQTAGAYNEDMGITSDFVSTDVYSGLEIDPEVSMQTVNNVVFYLKTLKPPIPRNSEVAAILIGKEIFSEIGCAKCHVPTLTTGYSSIEVLNNKTFHPYTDLLLHDMGSSLNDNYTEGFALTEEWKTPALWGLGLSKDSQGGQYHLLHDGRASSIESAIRYHGGEGENSKNAFSALDDIEKQQLINFLESL